MYEKSTLENGSNDLANFFIVFVIVRTKFMKENFWKIHRKCRIFITVVYVKFFKLNFPFLYVLAYHKKYSTVHFSLMDWPNFGEDFNV